jgi:hypothetical protein
MIHGQKVCCFFYKKVFFLKKNFIDEYNRKTLPKRYSLREMIAIQDELNYYKQIEMKIHPSSKTLVHLF